MCSRALFAPTTNNNPNHRHTQQSISCGTIHARRISPFCGMSLCCTAKSQSVTHCSAESPLNCDHNCHCATNAIFITVASEIDTNCFTLFHVSGFGAFCNHCHCQCCPPPLTVAVVTLLSSCTSGKSVQMDHLFECMHIFSLCPCIGVSHVATLCSDSSLAVHLHCRSQKSSVFQASQQANPAVSSRRFALAPLGLFKFVVPHEEANCHFWQVAYTRGTIHIGDTIFVIRGCAILLSTSHRAISTSHMRTF